MSRLTELKNLIKKFEGIQKKHKTFGACDTEPDRVFQVQLIRAIRGKDVSVPMSPKVWELYSDKAGAKKAAEELHGACQQCVDFIKTTIIGEADEIRKYLKDYCWRVS